MDTQDSHTLTINWGEGDLQTVSLSGGSFDIAHKYLDDNPTNTASDIYTIGVTLNDNHQGVMTKSTTTTITNEAPVIVGSISGPATAVPGQSVSYSAVFTDLGILDSHTVSINWGDGNITTGTVAETIGTGVGTATGSHTYAGHGTYTITFTLKDDDLGFTTTSINLAANPSIFVLHSTAAGAFTASGSGAINVTGLVVVDSNSTTAITASGNVRVTATNFGVVGGIKTTGNAQLIGPVTHALVPDPLAGLAIPALGTVQAEVSVTGNSSRTINPGTYSSISVSGNGLLTLTPGVYILAGGGFNVSGNGRVTGSRVSIVNSASATGSTGSISFIGNGDVTLTPTTSGPLTGILIFQPTNNVKDLTISGNAASALNGTIYAPKAQLNITVNGNLTETIIVDRLSLSSNGSNLVSAATASPAVISNSSGLVTSSTAVVQGLGLTTLERSQLTNSASMEAIKGRDQLFANLGTAPANPGTRSPIVVYKSLSNAKEMSQPDYWNLLEGEFLDEIAVARSTAK